jgi:hypothetical protein
LATAPESTIGRAMAQFLLITTLLTIAGLIATAIAGVMASPQHVAQHIFFALATVVIGLFSQSMTMFFFIGTGKELKDASQQDAHVVQRTKDFKSHVFPTAFYSMAVLMVTFIMGGGVGRGLTPHWLHTALTVASIAMYAHAYWVQIRAMDRNAELMAKYLRD